VGRALPIRSSKATAALEANAETVGLGASGSRAIEKSSCRARPSSSREGVKDTEARRKALEDLAKAGR
jgi:hypothetical protein